MFARVKKSGPREYLQIEENFREGKKVRQKIVADLERLDILKSAGALDSIATSLTRLSENVAAISSISARGISRFARKEGKQKME